MAYPPNSCPSKHKPFEKSHANDTQFRTQQRNEFK